MFSIISFSFQLLLIITFLLTMLLLIFHDYLHHLMQLNLKIVNFSKLAIWLDYGRSS